VGAAVAVLGCLLVGLLGAVAVAARASALSEAQAAAAQLVRLQTVRTSVVQADADATNAFLKGGLEPAAQRQDYTDSISLASRTLADASHSDQADAGQLGQVNDALTRYTGLIEAARANNRQGFPVGAAYLKTASGLLRSDVLPPLATATSEAEQRFDDATNRSNLAGTLLVVALVVGVVLLLGSQLLLAARTRRVLSIPVAVATLAVLLAGIGAVGAMSWAQNRATDVRNHQYAEVQALAQARGYAYDAKANEALTLIARGSDGGTYETAWQQSATNASASLDRAVGVGLPVGVRDSFKQWATLHAQIRDLDDEQGKWDDAVALATSTADDGSNAVFARFAQQSNDALTSAASYTDTLLGGTTRWLNLAAFLVLVAGLLGAVAAWWGFSIRLDDYR
jgi:hypothetical protein